MGIGFLNELESKIKDEERGVKVIESERKERMKRKRKGRISLECFLFIS